MVSFKLLTTLNEHIIYHNTTIISSVKMKWNMKIKQNLKVTKNDFYYITEKSKLRFFRLLVSHNFRREDMYTCLLQTNRPNIYILIVDSVQNKRILCGKNKKNVSCIEINRVFMYL